MPLVFRRSQAWLKWVTAGFLLLWVTAAIAIGAGGIYNLYIFVLPLLLLIQAQTQWLVLADRVLVVWNGQQIWRVPLAAAEVKLLKKGWQVRWPEGRIGRKLTFETPLEFYRAVERAVQDARLTEPGEAPRSEGEARLALGLARRSWSAGVHALPLIGVFTFAFLASFLESPLLLLPLAVVPFCVDWLTWGQGIALIGSEQIWLLNATGKLHPIPLTSLLAVQAVGRGGALVQTGDSSYPTLRLQTHPGEEPVAQHLWRRLAGGPPVPPGTGPRPEDPGRPEGPLRCSLCGRPEPGTVAGTGVFICQRCSGRARFEANESGHGLNPRDPKPM